MAGLLRVSGPGCFGDNDRAGCIPRPRDLCDLRSGAGFRGKQFVPESLWHGAAPAVISAFPEPVERSGRGLQRGPRVCLSLRVAADLLIGLAHVPAELG